MGADEHSVLYVIEAITIGRVEQDTRGQVAMPTDNAQSKAPGKACWTRLLEEDDVEE